MMYAMVFRSVKGVSDDVHIKLITIFEYKDGVTVVVTSRCPLMQCYFYLLYSFSFFSFFFSPLLGN